MEYQQLEITWQQARYLVIHCNLEKTIHKEIVEALNKVYEVEDKSTVCFILHRHGNPWISFSNSKTQ